MFTVGSPHRQQVASGPPYLLYNFDDGYGSSGGTLLDTQYSPGLTASDATFYLYNPSFISPLYGGMTSRPTVLLISNGTHDLIFTYSFRSFSLNYYISSTCTITVYNAGMTQVGSTSATVFPGWQTLSYTNSGGAGVRLRFSCAAVLYIDNLQINA